MSGWIKISREIVSHWLWQDAERLRWWLDLLFLASWEDCKCFDDGHLFTLRRGQMIASISFLCNRWGRSKPTIIAFLRLLERESMIYRQTLYRQTSILTICNYDKYQVFGETILDTQTDIIVDEQLDTIVDTSKETKNIYIASTSRSLSETSSDDVSVSIDSKKFIMFFNTEMDNANAIISRVKSISGQRLIMLKARCREYGKAAVCEAIKKAAASDFLNGGGQHGFKADFTWIFRPNNFPRILEGVFDNNKSHDNQNYNNGNNQQGNKSQRRGTEVTATSAEEYKTTF